MTREDECSEAMCEGKAAPSFDARMDAASRGKGPNDCWLWRGPTDREGYGRMSRNGVTIYVHRVAAARAYGPLPMTVNGKPTVVLHTCDVPGCINPRHLVIGTQADNMRDMVAKKRYQYGERHYAAKLTRRDVTRIRGLLRSGTKQIAIAEQYDVDPSLISRINSDVYWKEHV